MATKFKNGIDVAGSGAISTLRASSANELPLFGSELLLDANWGALTNWTKIATNQYQHTAGSTVALTNSAAGSGSNQYIISFTVAGRTAGTFTITFGGITSQSFSATDFWSVKNSNNGTFSINPTTDFNGTISISLKAISTNVTASKQILDSSSNAVIEIRTGGNQAGSNTFIGLSSGTRNAYNILGTGQNVSGFGNTGIGFGSLSVNGSGRNLTAIGAYAGNSHISGNRNTFIGYGAAYSSTTSANNTAIGVNAYYNGNGLNTVAIGDAALTSVTTGNANTGVGYQAGTNTTGGSNTAVGSQALVGVSGSTTGSNNTTVGQQSTFSITTGAGNSAIGHQAAYSITTGSNNTFVGKEAGNNASQLVSASNSTAIGYQAFTTASNQVVIGNSSVTQTRLQGELVVGGGTSGAVTLPYLAITGATTLDATHYVVNCTANTFTVSLPTAVGITGRTYVIKNTGTGTITVDGNGSETIDGALTAVLSSQYQSVTIQSTGTNWIII